MITDTTNYEEARYLLHTQYDMLKERVVNLLEDEESVASINASSCRFGIEEPYQELRRLEVYIDDYLLSFKFKRKDPDLERAISELAEYFSNLIDEHVEFDFSDIILDWNEQYDLLKKKVESILADDTLVNAIQSRPEFRGASLDVELGTLKVFLDLYQYGIEQGERHASAEEMINELEDYFSMMLDEHIKFDLPKIK